MAQVLSAYKGIVY